MVFNFSGGSNWRDLQGVLDVECRRVRDAGGFIKYSWQRCSGSFGVVKSRLQKMIEDRRTRNTNPYKKFLKLEFPIFRSTKHSHFPLISTC